MTRATAVVLCLMLGAGAGCRRDPRQRAGTEGATRQPTGPIAQAFFAWADERRQGVGDNRWPPSGDVTSALDAVSMAVADRIGTLPPDAAVAAMHTVIFDHLGFERETDSGDIQWMMLPAVLRHRRGNCFGLTALYLAVAERLDVPLRAVLVPGHIMPRSLTADGDAVYHELLRAGEPMPRAWYRARYGVPDDVRAYLRPLSLRELRALWLFNLGNADRLAGRLQAARLAYTEATTLFPELPEAFASRGLLMHLLGDLAAAEKDYAEAAALHPELPGLEKNRAVLRRELLEKQRRLRAGAGP